MTNPDSKNLGNFYLGETPLFVIDGKVSKSADFVGRLNFSDIEKVMLYYDKLELHQMFNAMGKNGAVVIDTKLPDFKLSPAEESDIFYLSGIQDSQEIFSFDQSTTNKTTPIFSPQIYWNPNLKTDDQGMLEFDFKHTDDLGENTK